MGLQATISFRWPMPRFDPMQKLWAALDSGGVFSLFMPQYIDPDDIGTDTSAPSTWRHSLAGEHPIPGLALTASARPIIGADRLASLYAVRPDAHVGFHAVGSVAQLHVQRGASYEKLGVFCHLPSNLHGNHVPCMAMSVVLSYHHGPPYMLVTLFLISQAWFQLPPRHAPEFPPGCVAANWADLLAMLREVLRRDRQVKIELDLKPAVRRQLADFGLSHIVDQFGA